MYYREVSDFGAVSTGLQGIPQNLLNVTGSKFFLYNEMVDGKSLETIDDKPDVVQLLYSDEEIEQYSAYPEPD